MLSKTGIARGGDVREALAFHRYISTLSGAATPLNSTDAAYS